MFKLNIITRLVIINKKVIINIIINVFDQKKTALNKMIKIIVSDRKFITDILMN